jgi:hypothetical protein
MQVNAPLATPPAEDCSGAASGQRGGDEMRFGTFQNGEVQTVNADTVIGTVSQFAAIPKKPGVYRMGKTRIIVMADPEEVRTEHVAVSSK